jgi:hypothetical protein
MEIQCCKCHRVREKDGWDWTDGVTKRPISFSYCPECLREFRHEAGLSRRDRFQGAPSTLAVAFG